jgi:hypothetical protein
MLKNTVIALIAAASVAGAAVPAFADYDVSNSVEENQVINRLAAQGINASEVENWGQLIRAFVTLEDGTTVMQFFDADTLQPA